MFIFVALWTSLAFGSELQWSWAPDGQVAYRLEATLVSPQGQTWPAEKNLNARVMETRITVETRCAGKLDGKNWVVDCSLDTVELSGVSLPGTESTAQTVLLEYENEMKGKTVNFRMGLDGRVKKFDLQGVNTRNSNHGLVLDGVRQILRRAFSPFDLQLPKNGDDRGKKWSQKGSPMVFEVMSAQGTAGGVSFKHLVSGRDGEAVRISSSGRAAVIDGVAIEAGASAMIRISVSGTSQFNASLGILDWSEVNTKTDHSTSNMQGLSKHGPPRYSARLGRVLETGEVLKASAL